MKEQGRRVRYQFGTMIEVPRAAITAGDIAQQAEFFSFGTNDLTQTTFGISRDDAETGFLQEYLAKGILPDNPFATLDQGGVGQLMRIGVDARPRHAADARGRHLRRARRRSAVDRLLPPHRPRLRQLLAVPGAGRASRRRACGAAREGGGCEGRLATLPDRSAVHDGRPRSVASKRLMPGPMGLRRLPGWVEEGPQIAW